MNSETYWRERERKWQEQQIKDDKKRMTEIEKRLRYAQDEIQKEINAQWQNFSNGEKISIGEAMKRADKMDVEAFARKAKEYVKNKDFSKRANEELKLYNLTMRVNRLELLKAQIGLELVSTFNELDKFMYDSLTQATINELKRQAGILNPDTPEGYYTKIAGEIVDGSFNVSGFPTFSDNLWAYQTELKADIDKLLVRSITQGVNPKVLAPELAKLLTDKGKSNTRYNTQRLMITETTRVQTSAQKRSYEDNEIDEYEFVAEPSACHTCKPLDGKVFKVKDMEPGTNAPNMHPYCKCSTVPYIDREAFEKELKERGL